MARHKTTSISQYLLLAPWWVSALLALFVYFGIRYGLPVLVESNRLLKPYGNGAPTYAKYVAVGLLAISLLSAIRSWRIRSQFEGQRSLDSLTALQWKEFEDLIGEFYRRKGYQVTETLGCGPDGGIDLKLAKDGAATFVQCKRWKGKKVGLPTVRELLGAMTAERAQYGVLVTTSSFTVEAVAFAKDHSIELIDGTTLLDAISPLQTNQKTTSKNSIPDMTTADLGTTVLCPKCGNQMTLRTARTGSNAGAQFWGCSKFPTCKGTRDMKG